jgi:hypothetical protein
MAIPNQVKDDRERAWAYYQHADNLQHQRHSIFIVAQSIFFAAYAQDPAGVGPIVAAVGIVYAVIWWYLSQRLSDGMDASASATSNPTKARLPGTKSTEFISRVSNRGSA